MDDETSVWAAVERANQTWLTGTPEQVAELFAPDAVMVGPDLKTVARGREALVQTYVDYVTSAQTESFDITARSVTVNGDVAVATYRFDVTYVIKGSRHQEVGQETLVFRRHAGDWKAIWRTMA